MRALVMGASGFVGNNLSRKLMQEGHEVIAFDHRKNDFAPKDHHYREIIGSFHDLDLLSTILPTVDWVFQLINTMSPSRSNHSMAQSIEDNVITNVMIMELCLKHDVKKFIFPSSGGTVYGRPIYLPINEDHPLEPLCSYGIVKLAVEKYLSLSHHLSGLDYCVLRVSNPYGPFQNPFGQQGAVTVFLGKVLQGNPIEIWGDGSIVRDYIYIQDVIDAFYLAAISRSSNKVFNVGRGQGISLTELIKTISDVVGVNPEVRFLPGRAMDVKENVLDISRAKYELGWEPRTGLAQGISLTEKWLRSGYYTFLEGKNEGRKL